MPKSVYVIMTNSTWAHFIPALEDMEWFVGEPIHGKMGKGHCHGQMTLSQRQAPMLHGSETRGR